MLNIEKIKSMTKAAAFEHGPEKKNLDISSYYRTDYLALQMVKSGIAYTAAFLILAAIWAMSRLEELMLKISDAEYLNGTIKVLVILFAVGLVIYEIGIWLFYSVKYEKAKKSVAEFHGHLKDIHKFYEAEEAAEEEVLIEFSTEEMES